MINYKLFMPEGATEHGDFITLKNGLSFPKYAFVAVPIVSTKSSIAKDILEDSNADQIYYDLKTNQFVFEKKVKNIQTASNIKPFDSLNTSTTEGLIKFNFDGYLNISNLISNIKKQIVSIKEKEASIVAFEQDIGYTTVRFNNLFPYSIVAINETDDFENLSFQISDNYTLRDFLVYQLRPQNLVSQRGLIKRLLVRNLKNLAVNVCENLLNNFFNGDKTKFEIISAFSNEGFYVPDEEFYSGEAIQLRFPGLSSSGVYLLAKELISSLFFDKIYLDYFYDNSPRITIIMKESNTGYEFGTRFEYNLIHSNRLVNIDPNYKDFEIDDNDIRILEDLSLSGNFILNKLPITNIYAVQKFIREALELGYIQSTEEAIKFAYATGIDLSDLSPGKTFDNNEQLDTFYEDIDYNTTFDSSLAKEELTKSIIANLPKIIKCPEITNGGFKGYPDDRIFPMMASPAFKVLNDLTMIYDQEKVSGQKNIPLSIKTNNPLLVDYIKGVTDKVEDTFIGVLEGKSVYANRIGGLAAGIRQMQNLNLSGKSLQSVTSMLPVSSLSQFLMGFSKAFFGVSDITGSLLGCSQFDFDNGNANDQIVLIASMIASIAQSSKSPMPFEEISVALDHVKGKKDQFNKKLDGSKVNETRDTTKEQTIAPTKVDQNANSTPIMIANVQINSTKILIQDKLGTELETKTERKKNQTIEYVKYDPGSNHKDNLADLGSSIISGNKKDVNFS